MPPPEGFLKWWYPQIIHLDRVFHYKPAILGYPYFWKRLPRITHFCPPHLLRSQHWWLLSSHWVQTLPLSGNTSSDLGPLNGTCEDAHSVIEIQLMLQKSGVHQLRLVVSSLICRVLYILSVVIAGFLNHRQYIGDSPFLRIVFKKKGDQNYPCVLTWICCLLWFFPEEYHGIHHHSPEKIQLTGGVWCKTLLIFHLQHSTNPTPRSTII